MTVGEAYEALRGVVPGGLTPWAALSEQDRADLTATVGAWRLPPETLRTLRSADDRAVRGIVGLARLFDGAPPRRVAPYRAM